MSEHLSRQAQHMLTTIFHDCEPSYEKDRFTIRGVSFLLNNRAISYLNQMAADARGQYDIKERDESAPFSGLSPSPRGHGGPSS